MSSPKSGAQTSPSAAETIRMPHMPLAVLNPGGSDPDQLFADGAGPRDAPGHAPVNYHAYAACTRGGFFRDAAKISDDLRNVLVLLRKDLRPALRAVRELRRAGRIVAVSWKESGPFQIARQLEGKGAPDLFRAVCAEAHGTIASTPEAVLFYREGGARLVEYVPTPYPVDDPRWNFSRPLSERTGIFIGTREWKEPSRRHEEAVREALALGVPVTVVNESGWLGSRRLKALGVARDRILRRMSYTDYLAAMAQCRVVFQRDSSAVPGQIAGDALLCRMPCVGGNGAVDREAFDDGADLATLLRDDAAWQAAVDESQRRATERLSFGAVDARLREFFERIAS
jgi:hypothetical protein